MSMRKIIPNNVNDDADVDVCDILSLFTLNAEAVMLYR